MQPLKKIVAIGPESTGKSTLCELLASHYGAQWVPEHARSYLMDHGKHYGYDDLLTIAKGQIGLEEDIVSRTSDLLATGASPLLFIDTDLYVVKVWCEFVFGKCHHWILQQIASRKYELYLLCAADLPWAPDELREYPDLATREKLFHIYKDLLIQQATPWMEIRGTPQERLLTATRAVDGLL